MNRFIIYILGLLVSSGACTDAPIGQTSVDSTPPPPPADVKVEPLPGGAKITYSLPKETDISYVRGDFRFQGKDWTVRASAFDNCLTVLGLGAVAPVEMKLCLVDHSENRSTPINVTFTPDRPPFETVFESMTVEAGWGGVLVKWDNPSGADMGITLFAADTLGQLNEGSIHFSSAKKGEWTFRPYAIVKRRFGVMVTDQWGNSSGIRSRDITPKRELKAGAVQRVLPYDNNSEQNGQSFSWMFDGNKVGTGNISWHSAENHALSEYRFQTPILFTIDLGSSFTPNRFVLWQGRWAENFLYSHHNPRLFELWGTADLQLGQHPETLDDGSPNPYWLEDWKQDWTPFGNFEIAKPSGLPMGQTSDADVSQANAGHEFMLSNISVRYVRFVINATWVGNKDNTITIHELEFWGQ
ncbi:MAG: DUF4959 domain-containing protein [Prevotellaceae bacterium]|nr:DUF4959 domain-containing protein [Prevotellaceae bacterium]